MGPLTFETFGEQSVELANKLINELNRTKAPSVSAPEIGINYKVFAVRSYPGEPVFVAFNPKIVYYSDEVATAEETCFSYPGLKVRITRPYAIRARFQEPYGITTTKAFDGAIARLFQHEMCHMEEKIFWNDANFFHRNRAIKQWKQISRRLDNKTNAA